MWSHLPPLESRLENFCVSKIDMCMYLEKNNRAINFLSPRLDSKLERLDQAEIWSRAEIRHVIRPLHGLCHQPWSFNTWYWHQKLLLKKTFNVHKETYTVKLIGQPLFYIYECFWFNWVSSQLSIRVWEMLFLWLEGLRFNHKKIPTPTTPTRSAQKHW